jgi:hypothetical protein
MAVICGRDMVELVRSNDLVYLSWVQAQLAGAGIDCLLTDQYTSVIEGSIGAIPRRILVDGEDIARARRLLREAEAALGHE